MQELDHNWLIAPSWLPNPKSVVTTQLTYKGNLFLCGDIHKIIPLVQTCLRCHFFAFVLWNEKWKEIITAHEKASNKIRKYWQNRKLQKISDFSDIHSKWHDYIVLFELFCLPPAKHWSKICRFHGPRIISAASNVVFWTFFHAKICRVVGNAHCFFYGRTNMARKNVWKTTFHSTFEMIEL